MNTIGLPLITMVHMRAAHVYTYITDLDRICVYCARREANDTKGIFTGGVWACYSGSIPGQRCSEP